MTIIIIPSFECNFRCKYCYLCNSTKQKSYKLNVDFVSSFLSQLKGILPADYREVKIIWHGGEPLLWGIDNYRKVFEFLRCELSDLIIKNSIQSNLSLINDDYIDLFQQYDVKLGFSFDGPKEINDVHRLSVNGMGSYDIIMEKLKLCRTHELNVGCVAVCSRKFIGNVKQIYNFMNEQQLNFKLNPLFITGEAVNIKDMYGVTAMEYANIMVELFDIMMNNNHSISEDNLLEMGIAVATGATDHCQFGCNCQDHFLAIAPTGDVMPCGRFCDNDLLKYSYGNLHNESLAEILPRIKQSETYKRAEYIAQSGCAKCKWYSICHGGCLHDGFLASGDFRHKTFLCSAYQKIFAHIEKRLHENGIC